MAENTHKLYYDGPDGATNVEVARATGRPAGMKHGEHYEGIPEDLAVRLLLTADWHELKGKEKLKGKVKELVEAEDAAVQPGAASSPAEPPEPEALEGSPGTRGVTAGAPGGAPGAEGGNA